MITPEKAAELLLSTTAGPWDWNEGYQGLSGANGYEVLAHLNYEGMWVPSYTKNGPRDAELIAAAPDMAALIAKQAFDIERLREALVSHEKQWNKLQDLLGAYEAKRQEHGIEVIKWEQDT
jgi:hypothetical protein